MVTSNKFYSLLISKTSLTFWLLFFASETVVRPQLASAQEVIPESPYERVDTLKIDKLTLSSYVEVRLNSSDESTASIPDEILNARQILYTNTTLSSGRQEVEDQDISTVREIAIDLKGKSQVIEDASNNSWPSVIQPENPTAENSTNNQIGTLEENFIVSFTNNIRNQEAAASSESEELEIVVDAQTSSLDSQNTDRQYIEEDIETVTHQDDSTAIAVNPEHNTTLSKAINITTPQRIHIQTTESESAINQSLESNIAFLSDRFVLPASNKASKDLQTSVLTFKGDFLDEDIEQSDSLDGIAQQAPSINLPRISQESRCELLLGENDQATCYLNQLNQAETDRQNATQDSEIAQAWLLEGDSYLGLGRYDEAKTSFQQAIDGFGQQFPDIKVSALAGSASAYLNLNNTDLAEEQAQAALVTAADLPQESKTVKFLTLAGFFYELGNSDLVSPEKQTSALKESAELGERVLDILDQEQNQRQREKIIALSLLGAVYGSLEEYEKAISFQEQLPSLYEAAGKPLAKANALLTLGDLHSLNSTYVPAIAAYEKAETLFVEHSAEEPLTEELLVLVKVKFRIAEAYLNQGLELSNNGRSEALSNAVEATKQAQEILKDLEKQYSDEEETPVEIQLSMARALELRGNILFAREQYGESISDWRNAALLTNEISAEIFDNETRNILDKVALVGDVLQFAQLIFPPIRGIALLSNLAGLASIADDIPVFAEAVPSFLRGVSFYLRDNRRDDLLDFLEDRLKVIQKAESVDRLEEVEALVQLAEVQLNYQRYEDAEDNFDKALTIIGESDAHVYIRYSAESLLGLAEIDNLTGNNDSALNRVSQVLQLTADESLWGVRLEEKDRRQGLEAEARLSLSRIALKTGRYATALQEGEGAYNLFEDLGDRHLSEQAQAQLILGQVYLRLRQYPESQNHAQTSQALYRQAQDLRGEAHALLVLSDIYFNLGQYKDSLNSAERALYRFQDFRDKAGKASAFRLIGNALQAQKRYEEAEESFILSSAFQEEVTKEIRPQGGPLKWLARLGTPVVNFVLGRTISNPFRLNRITQAVYALNTITNFTAGAVNYSGTEDGYFIKGDYEQAKSAFKRSISISKGLGDRIGEAQARLGLSNLYSSQEEYEDAEDAAKAALEIFQDTEDLYGEAYTLLALSQLYIDLGELEEETSRKHREYLELSINNAQRASVIFQLASTVRGEADRLSKSLEDERQFQTKQTSSPSIDQRFQSCNVDDQSGVALSYSRIGDALSALDENELAIVFYKEAVACREIVRQNVNELSVRLQRSYTGTLVETYRRLADLLLRAGRTEEALDIMELLKLQEIDEYFNKTRQVTSVNSITIFGGEENELRALIEEQQNSTIAETDISVREGLARLTELRWIIDINNPDRRRHTDEESAEFDLLGRVSDKLTNNFSDYLLEEDEIREWVKKQEDLSDDPILPLDPEFGGRFAAKYIKELQNIKIATGQDAILLYPVVLKDRLELIVVTSDGLITNESVEEVNSTSLSTTVGNFLGVLETRGNQELLLEAAQNLFEWLITPI